MKLDDLARLAVTIVDEGFHPKRSPRGLDTEDAGWRVQEYIRPSDGQLPELRFIERVHDRYGINMVLNSIPPNQQYYFATEKPVDPKEGSRILQAYMESVKSGKRYWGGN